MRQFVIEFEWWSMSMTLSPYRIIYFWGRGSCEIMRGDVGWSLNRRCMGFLSRKLTYLWHQRDHIIKCHIWHHRNEMNEGILFCVSTILKEFYCYFESYYFSLDANEYGNMSSLKTNIERSLTNPEKLAKTSTLPYRRIYSFPWTSYSGTDSLHDSERTSELICARFVF